MATAMKEIITRDECNDTYGRTRMFQALQLMAPDNVKIPCEGTVVKVAHQDGNYLKAYLPKASTENERSMVVIRTPHGVEVMARQIAGAMARRIVTYAKEGEECFIDDHMGFIKFGSRVDVYLPLGTEVLVKMGQATVGDETLIARLK